MNRSGSEVLQSLQGACLGAGDSLQEAQERKLAALIAAAGSSAADHVLEIGCGWGSLAIRAVQVGPLVKFYIYACQHFLRHPV